MHCQFTKMHGLGNDFVLLDGRRQPLLLDPGALARLADRRLGVGCDQILVLDAPRVAGASVRYRIFNADGSTAEHCGNGVRCVARYLLERGEVEGNALRVEIGATLCELTALGSGEVRVMMGEPDFVPAHIPLGVAEQAPRYGLYFEGREWEFGAVSMGNPHAVFPVADETAAPVAALGAHLQSDALFPARVNVGFMRILTPDTIRLRVWERGAGETPACGTGACAAVAVGRRWGLLGPVVDVQLRGGVLRIEWEGPGNALYMTGPAQRVFEGSIEL